VDLTASLKNMDLGPVTPYSGKYAGYAIDKGKLSLDLKYSIDKKELNAKNDVLIDQLTFGESVESEDATKLPPFALLDALYPGAAELSTIEFEPGRAALNDTGRGRLTELARIMQDRSSLNLEITGFVDADRDRTGLVTTLFERKLKAVKLKDLLRAGKQASNIDEIIIEPDEYGAYLKKAYKAETFKKPTNFLGIETTLPDVEMKKLMLEPISVSDDDLKDLATALSQRVRDELIDEHHIEAARIFLVDADPFNPDSQDAAVNSRVSLTIR
jgi:hypothetical protein